MKTQVCAKRWSRVELAMATTKHGHMEKVKYKSKTQEHWIRSISRKRENGNHPIIHSDQELNVTTNENQEDGKTCQEIM